jgi:hypothetical protein
MTSFACDCSCYADDYEHAEVSIEDIVKARKEHICCECREVIIIGEKYERAKLLYDGSWSVYDTCLPCARIRSDYCPHGWIYGSLVDMLLECLGFDYRYPPPPDDDENSKTGVPCEKEETHRLVTPVE